MTYHHSRLRNKIIVMKILHSQLWCILETRISDLCSQGEVL